MTFSVCFHCGYPPSCSFIRQMDITRTHSSYSSILATRIEPFCFQSQILPFRRRYINWATHWTPSSRWPWHSFLYLLSVYKWSIPLTQGCFVHLWGGSSDTYWPHGSIELLPSLCSVWWVNKWARVTAKGWMFLHGCTVIVDCFNKRLRGTLRLSSSRGLKAFLGAKGFPGSSMVKRICLPSGRHSFNPWFRQMPWRRKWWPIPVFLPGQIHE